MEAVRYFQQFSVLVLSVLTWLCMWQLMIESHGFFFNKSGNIAFGCLVLTISFVGLIYFETGPIEILLSS